MLDDGVLLIGKIIGVHGLNGNLKVSSFSESPSIFSPGSNILVKKLKEYEKEYTVESAKPYKNGILLSFTAIKSRNAAEEMIGAELFVQKESLPALDEGSFYWFDLIGLSVFTDKQVFLGRVTSVFSTGANDVYVVNDPENPDTEILIPALKKVVKCIDLSNSKMYVDLPEGL